MTTPAALPEQIVPRSSGRRSRLGLLVLAAIVVWLAVGLLRGPTVATAAFETAESGRQVSDIRTTAVPMAVPLVFVHVEATVTEAGGAR